MKTSEILIKAKEVIVNPENWIQNYYAYNKNGSPVGRGTHPDAVCFCSVGALQKVVGSNVPDNASEEFLNSNKIRELTKVLGEAAGETITEYNDSHTHSAVMEVWDKAIELSLQNELEESK